MRERRSIGELDHGADPEEPAQPHRDVGGVRCLVRVEPEHLEKPRLYCAHRCLHLIQAPIPAPQPKPGADPAPSGNSGASQTGRVEADERRAAHAKDPGGFPDWIKAPATAMCLRHLLSGMRVRTWSVTAV